MRYIIIDTVYVPPTWTYGDSKTEKHIIILKSLKSLKNFIKTYGKENIEVFELGRRIKLGELSESG